jgi:hypothetical protein
LVIGLAAKNHPGITLRLANGASLVSLGEFGGDRVGILVFDQAGEIAFTMVVHPDGTRHISCHDQTGKVAWQIQPPYQV